MKGWKTGALVAALSLLACGKVTRNGSGSIGGPGVDDDDTIIDGSDAGVDEDASVVDDIDWPPIPDCVPTGIPATSQLPRLKNAQYDNTIRALTGLDTEPSRLLAPDSLGSMDARLWDGYRNAAVYVAEAVMSDQSLRDTVIPCSGADEACAREFIQEFGRRAYRRPLTDAEAARYEALYTERAELTESGSFDEAMQLMLEVFLISPSFLMTNELSELPESQYFKLDSYEMASRLSYLFWDSMPDEELFSLAAADALQTPEAILAQATRLLQHPNARLATARFHRAYLRVGSDSRWTTVQHDTNRYPAFDIALTPWLVEETERIFDFEIFDRQASFQGLLTTSTGFVNSDTAPLYGLDPADYGQDLEMVEFDPEVRPGVFTRAGFLSAYAHFDHTSPTGRGAYLQNNVLCTDLPPPPPPDVHQTSLPMDPNLVTLREQTESVTMGAACVGCHEFIDPGGYALEGFDAVGQVQTTDNDQGVPVDTNATVHMGGGVYVEVDGASKLMNTLAASPATSVCYAQKWVEHAYQRQMNQFDQCVAFDIARELHAGAPVVDGLALVTQADAFRLRAQAE